MAIDYTALGARVAKYRKLASLTQESLAEKADISLGMISTVEAGKTKASIETLVKLANALDTTVDALLYDSLEDKETILLGRIRRTLEGCTTEQLELAADSLDIQKKLIEEAK